MPTNNEIIDLSYLRDTLRSQSLKLEKAKSGVKEIEMTINALEFQLRQMLIS